MDTVEESFIENNVPYERIQKLIKHTPITLKNVNNYFDQLTSKIFKAESVKMLFVLLSNFWDYLNPGLFEFIVGRFGSEVDIQILNQYLGTLQIFRKNVALRDFVKFALPHSSASSVYKDFNYKEIVSFMGEVWEQKTLQDAEELKHELCSDYKLLQMFLLRFKVASSSIAIIFYFPDQVEINMEELEPFFDRNIRYSDGYCWTRKVFCWIQFV